MPIEPITDLDPVEVALEMLKEELPGFESLFSKRNMAVQVTGSLRVGSQTDAHIFYYPIPVMVTYVDLDLAERRRQKETNLERAERLDRERNYIRRMITPIVANIVESARTLGIEALNLEPVMKAREEQVRREAHMAGHSEGFENGKRAGRREAFKELLEAADLDVAHFLGEDE